jgi:hypothetical protein
MRAKDIEPGKRYIVRLSEDQSLVFRGCKVEATVLRAGFHYDVERTRGSMVRGASFTDVTRSEHPSGVEVSWEAQDVESVRRHMRNERATAGSAVINARSVLRPA